MLNLTTTLLMMSVNLTLQGLVWLLVWLTQRHLFELRFVAAGFIAFAIGLLFLFARSVIPISPAAFIIAQNYFIHLGMVALTHGIARFLDQRGNPLLMWTCAAFVVIFWPAALAIAPENVAIRILASNAVGFFLLAFMIWLLAVDRVQPRLLRWTTIVLLGLDIVALLGRTVFAVQSLADPMDLLEDPNQAWYFFFFNFFASGLFLMLLIMVGVRLSYDLRQKNEILQKEVAQRRILQEQLSNSLDTEKALREEQKQLLRMVTHEFRTPLAIVDRAAEMIGVVLPNPPETVNKRLSSIHDAVQRLVQLINRFLDAERRDASMLQAERIDIRALLSGVRRHFEGIEVADRLQIEVDDNLPYYRGDAEMLDTVLINLVDNALKYAPDGSPVSIRAWHEDNAIIIAVSDRGIGIPDAEIASIGRRFFRASNTTPATGTGLGLHNARRLLEYHNGRLTLRVNPGGGTIATIRLPLPGLAVPGLSEAS